MIAPTGEIRTSLRSAASLEDVTTYLKRLTEDKALEDHLHSKLRHNWQSFPIPPNDRITSLAKMQDGFIVGLQSGFVMIVNPPSVWNLPLHQEPVVGLFAASNYFLVTATKSCLKIWNAQTEAEFSTIPCAVLVTCVTGSIIKELFFIGQSNGAIAQYHINDKLKCDVSLKSTFTREGENTGVSDMKTNDTTTWLAARYVSNALILWDHLGGAMLYHFTFTAGPGLPNVWVLGETTNLPKWFEPKVGWDVFPEIIVFSSPLILRMSGSNVSKMYSSRRLVESDDPRWQAYGDNLKKGHVSSWCENTLITITKPGAVKKTISEKTVNEVELDLGLEYTLTERSEANNYLAFACPEALEVLCLAAIETTFVHRISGPAELSKSQGYFYSRFHRLLNQWGESLLTLGIRERVLGFSPNCQWVTCTSERRDSQVSTTFTIKNVASSSIPKDEIILGRCDSKLFSSVTTQTFLNSSKAILLPEEWAKDRIIRHSFSKDSSFIALLFTQGLIIYKLEDQIPVYTLRGKFKKETCRLKFDLAGRLFMTEEKRLSILYTDFKTRVEIPWKYSRICFLDKDATEAIAYNMSHTCRCTIESNELKSVAEMNEGFEVIETLNKHQHCVGLNDSGVFLFSSKDLTKLVHFKPGSQITISKAFPVLLTFCSDPDSALFGMIEVWDLKLGLNVQSFSSGLKSVLGNKLTVRGPGTWADEKMKIITKLVDRKARIKNTWIMNLEQFISAQGAEHVHEPPALSIWEEQFERQCIVWKKLAALVSTGTLSPELTYILIKPFNLNTLHLLAHKSQASLLTQAMEAGTSIIRSTFGSPLTLCIAHKSRKSLDALLYGLIRLRETNLTKFASAMYHINDDFLEMMAFGSRYLSDFLKLVVIPLPDDVLANTVIKPISSLPDIKLCDDLWIDAKMYEQEGADEKEKITVEYLLSPIYVYIELGSRQSIKALKILTTEVDDMGVFTAPFIQQIIDLKWNKMWWVILVHTLLYWCLLVAMVCMMFDYGSRQGITVVYVFLNSLFLAIEAIQICGAPMEYFQDYWNYVDLSRAALTYSWIFTNYNSDLTFVVVLLSMIRGVSSFQAFDHTRFYIRMIFDVVKGTISFIWIFFYFTFSFGLLYEAACFQNMNNPMNSGTTDYYFWNAWTTSMELNMGNFNVDGYGLLYWLVFMFASCIDCFIMLNLVVAVLGDAFDKFQSNADAADVVKKAELLYEYELMMRWRRGTGVKRRLQICQEEGGGNADGDWGGKVSEVKKQLDDMQKELLGKIKEENKQLWKKMKKETPKEDMKFAQINEAIVHLKSEVGRLANLMQERGA